MRKKVDKRLRTLIEKGVKTRHRSFFVIIGDKSLNQIVNLHYMLSKSVVKSRPNVLWCYKEKLEFYSHNNKKDKEKKGKRAKKIKKLTEQGLLDPEGVDSFSLFLETGDITYCKYNDSERVLGNTFGMCILQDFEALTPNLLARTIETVEGGGLILLLLRSLSSLTSLYTMVMDVHDRYKTPSHPGVTGRFNERFLLSLASCKTCVLMDDELNVLPISSNVKSITPVSVKEGFKGLLEAEQDLKNLKDELADAFPVGLLISECRTLDQGKAVVTFLDAILEKTLRSTVALLAARGRGKSAALGLAVAGAIAAGYSNIFVTAPTPENLNTFFRFVSKGFDMLEYKEHLDYDLVKSNNPEFKKAIVRINIYKQHRQTIQYIEPHEHEKLSQVELLVIDEAGAIPLPVIKSLIGPYLVFLSSTVNGYEGTGRSLSLKLLDQLEAQSRISTESSKGSLSGRSFKKIELSESVRYSSGDLVESWLHALLCLDVNNFIPNISTLPPPGECNLYYVNRDTLFSYHKDSELFLQRMMALYVASHYKNSPNDLQLMADAPAHHLFVLLGPVDESRNQLPDILCVIQVCLEGQIPIKEVQKKLAEGKQPNGDQIPWKFVEQFKDTVFPTLTGARVVRIATHPSAMKLGYGSAAIEQLTRYFEGQLTQISEVDVENASEHSRIRVTVAAEKASLLEENIKPRTDLPPLLVQLCERQPEKLHYIGVSFGLTLDLLRFWKRHKFAPFYVAHNPNSVTGEHTCMALKPLVNDDIEASGSDEWGFFSPFYQDFRKKFTLLLGSSSFRTMEHGLALSVLDLKTDFTETEPAASSTSKESLDSSLSHVLSPYDMARLEAFVNSNLADYLSISYLEPILALLYFDGKLPVTLSRPEASILLCMGLQRQELSYVEGAMKKERNAITTMYKKIMTRFYTHLNGVASNDIDSTLPRQKEVEMKPHAISLDEDLDDAAKQVKDEMRAKKEGMLDPELVQRYAIVDREADFESALRDGSGRVPSGGLVSIKSNKSRIEKHGKQQKEGQTSGKKRGKDERGSKSNKKKKF